ncbi:MAG: ABC transporter permease subunit [Tissierellia bacterium]|nr:ABC transporter permease subunit [Tissierellia bacterium]
MKKKFTPYLLLLPQIGLTLLLITSLLTGIIQSFGVIPAFNLFKPSLKYYIEIFARPDIINSIFFSLKITLISSLLATFIGLVICGLLVSNKEKTPLVNIITHIPITVPHIVVALFTVIIFSQNGVFARLAYLLGFISEQQEFPRLIYDQNGIGVIISYLWKEIPFIIYFIHSLMSRVEGSLGEAARDLGANKFQSFIKVTLPLSSRVIISGFLIIFIFTLGAYELPLLLGATIPKALPVLAYQEYLHPDLRHRPYAMALNGIIILISLISSIIYYFLMKKRGGGYE